MGTSKTTRLTTSTHVRAAGNNALDAQAREVLTKKTKAAHCRAAFVLVSSAAIAAHEADKDLGRYAARRRARTPIIATSPVARRAREAGSGVVVV